jgi:hypothetical protein
MLLRFNLKTLINYSSSSDDAGEPDLASLSLKLKG